MASAQDSDPDITRLRSSQTSLTLEPIPLPMSESTILCDTSTGVARLVVPFMQFSTCSTPFPTQEFELHKSFLQTGMYGPTLTLMYAGGLYNVRNPKFNVI